jgi:hypothetical protein
LDEVFLGLKVFKEGGTPEEGRGNMNLMSLNMNMISSTTFSSGIFGLQRLASMVGR